MDKTDQAAPSLSYLAFREWVRERGVEGKARGKYCQSCGGDSHCASGCSRAEIFWREPSCGRSSGDGRE